MSYTAYPIPNLINGVSQQAAQQRRDTQGEDQINCINSPVDGNYARAGSNHVGLLEGEDFTGAFVEDVVRSDDEQYRIIIDNGQLRVFDLLTGEEGAVEYPEPDAVEYLGTYGQPEQIYRAITIEDTTYIVNREVVVNMVPVAPTPPAATIYEGFIYVRTGDYLNTYTVFVQNGSTWYSYYHSTPNNDANNQSQIKADFIANKIYDVLVNGQGSNPALGTMGFTVTRLGSVIRIRRTGAAGGNFDVGGEDGANGDRMLVFKDRVTRHAQLPNVCWDGTVVRIKGSADNSDLDYYVQYIGEGTSGRRGVWEECAKPGIPTFLNRKSMPHILRSLGNNEYEFTSEIWNERIAGDGAKKGRDPSFVGKPIEDLGFWRDRLGLMTESSMSFSKASQFYTFFPDTVQTVLEDAPIHVRIASSQIAILKHAVTHAESLFLWSDKVQFVVQAGEELTEKTIEVKPTTAFDYSSRIRPRGIGENLVFTYESGSYAQLAEQFATVQGVNKEASDITAHVPKFIPAGLRWLTGSTTLKVYAVNSEREPNVIYVYNYFLVGEEKQQSAWSKWTFPDDHNIIHAKFNGSTLNLMVQRPDGVAFETLDCSPSQIDPGGYYLTRLDRRVSEESCTWVFDPVTGTTKVTLPYDVGSASEVERACLVTRVGGSITEGGIYDIAAVIGNEVEVVGDLPMDAKFYFGFIPVSEYEFSPFYPKDERGAHLYERTQVGAVLIAYSRTGWTRAVVTRNNGRTYNNVFAGRVLGSPQNRLDAIAIADGTFRVPVKSASDNYRLRLINDSPFPSAWQSATVNYRPTVRAQRVS